MDEKTIDIIKKVNQHSEELRAYEAIKKNVEMVNEHHNEIVAGLGLPEDVELVVQDNSNVQENSGNSNVMTSPRFKKVIKVGGTLVLVTAVLAGGVCIIEEIHEYQQSQEIKNDLGYVATGKEASIVDLNTSIGRYENGDQKVIYDEDGIASCIETVCEENPEYFSLVMSEVYDDLKYNALSNMDSILKCLQNDLQDNENLQSIYESIQNYDVFLEYLQGTLDTSDKDFDNLDSIINLYKDKSISYDDLSENDKDTINKLVNLYAKEQQRLEAKYIVEKDNEKIQATNLGDILASYTVDGIIPEEQTPRTR